MRSNGKEVLTMEEEIKTVSAGDKFSEDIQKKSEKMGKMPVGRLILTMSLPAIFSMLVQALYNIVDSIYVAQITGFGTAPTDAVSIAFPFQMLLMAFAIGIGVGGNSLIARHLGRRDNYSASKVASTGMVVSIAHCAVFVILGFTAIRPIVGLFTSDSVTADMSTEYLSVCMIFSIFMYVEIFINKVNQAMSKMTIPMISQLIGAITNIILDPIFIFSFGLGVKGAAIATVIGQCVACIFTVITFAVKKSEVSISPKYVRLKGHTILDIYKIGLPTIILNAVGSFTTMAMNFIMKSFNFESGITILGVYFKVQSFVFMPCFGLNQGLLPILAYNYGANKKDRFVKAYRIAITVALCIMAVGFTLFMTLSGGIISIFKNVAEIPALKEAAVSAFRVFSISFIPAGFCIITITMFQSVGHGIKSMLMSMLRQLVFLIPIALFITAVINPQYIWWAYPIAEVLVASIFMPIAFSTVKKVFARRQKKEEAANAV